MSHGTFLVTGASLNRSFVEFPWLLHLVLVGNDCRLQRGRHRRSGHSKHNQRQLPIEMATTTCSISKAIYTGRSVVDKTLGASACFAILNQSDSTQCLELINHANQILALINTRRHP